MYRGSASSQTRTQAERSARGVHPLFICLIGIGTVQPVFVVFAAERCPAANATKVVSVQGNVTWSLINNAALQSAKLNDVLCVGDTVRVGAKSRAVLRLPNETTIPLDQNTVFRLKEAIAEKDPTLIELIQGAIHVITRTPKPFKVNTPYLNAFVEGTEFYVGVDESEARVAVIEGKVKVSNDQGAVLLIDNEAATARKGQAPQKTLTIKPRDAVQWALYYPPLFDPRSRAGGENLAASHERYSQGNITGAIESLEAIPEAQRNEDYATYRAGLLLLVGRADEAEPDIERALAENGNNTDALSLKAIIAIVKNDKAKALELANQAANIDDKSASARIALSYALQANFKIENALKAAREATVLDADNALAWARVAELELSIPNYDKSKEAAEKAVKLNPNLARTQSVLGFSNLTRIDVKAAKESFNKAIELDQADPLPRLGLGLAIIREGKLEEGREQIEIATSLDPENSLIRSYLGKVYFEEKFAQKAAVQFDLAKERDRNDPTPYFYDAIRLATENKPVAALDDFEKSIQLNNNRLVSRSGLLLDDDAAVRAASLASVSGELGFERLAVVNAAKALTENFGNDVAHRELALSYTDFSRHDIARVSESLQARLRQPVAIIAVDSQVSNDKLGVLKDSGPFRLGANEFNQMFQRDGASVQFDGIAGNRGTIGNQFLFGGSFNDTIAYSFNQVHYETDGFRENNQAKKKIYDVFFMASPSRSTSLQLEAKRTESSANITFYPFEPNPDIQFAAKIGERSDIARLGGRYSSSNASELIWSAMTENRERTAKLASDGLLLSNQNARASNFEVQQSYAFENSQIVAGIGHLLEKAKFPVEESEIESRSTNIYLYGSWQPQIYDLTILAGLAYDSVELGLRNATASLEVNRHKASPKLGVIWSPTANSTIRLSAFSAVKRPLIGSMTIEPTQIVGFNQFFTGFPGLFQFYGEPDGTASRRVAVAYDQQITPRAFSGIEFSQRRLSIPLLGQTSEFSWRETEFHSYLYLTRIFPGADDHFRKWQLALSAEYEYEKLERDEYYTGVEGILNLSTHRVPFGIKAFSSSGVTLQMGATFLYQKGLFSTDIGAPQFPKEDKVWVMDLSAEYRLPGRLGLASLAIKNVLDKQVNLFDVDPLNPRVALGRLILGKLKLVF